MIPNNWREILQGQTERDIKMCSLCLLKYWARLLKIIALHKHTHTTRGKNMAIVTLGNYLEPLVAEMCPG